MEISIHNRQGEVDHVRRVASEQPNELDSFRESKHEGELCPECILTVLHVPVGGSPPARSQQERVNGKGERGKSCKVQGVGAPGLLPPDVSLANKTSPVASPVASGPAGALVQKLEAVFQRSLQLALSLVLDPRLPLVIDQPARNKIVVVGVKNPFAPLFILEAVEELVALENLSPVRAGPAGHARRATINVVGCRDLKVTALNVRSAKPVPAASSQWCVPFTAHSLTGSNSSHASVFERRQNPRHESGWPGNVVIGHDGNGSRDSGQGFTDLKPLIRDWRLHNTDVGVWQGESKLVQRFSPVMGGNKNKLGRFTSKNAHERRSKFFKHIMNGGNNDCDIGICVLGLFWQWLRLVSPVADAVDNETEITMDPMMTAS